MNEDFYSMQKDNDGLDLGTIFRFLLMQSKMILSFIAVAFILSYLNFIFSTKQFKIQSLLQYESFNQNIFDPTNTMQMSGGNPSIDIMNLATLYESRTNIVKVIKDLKLNIEIRDLLPEDEVDMSIVSNEKNQYTKHKLKFSFSDNEYFLLDDDKNIIVSSNFGEYMYFDDLKILIKSSNIKKSRVINVNFRHPESMYNRLKSEIVIDSTTSLNSFFAMKDLLRSQ